MEGVDDFSNIVREWRKKIPQDYPDVAFCILHALGQIHYDEGNFGESLDCFLQELPLRKKVLGKNHISVSYVLVAIASIMYLHERVNQAAYYLKEAINVITFHQYRRKNTTNLMLESNRMIWYRLSDTLNDIGNRHFLDGNLLVAVQFYKSAVKASIQPEVDECYFSKFQADEINRAVQESIDNYVRSASQKLFYAHEIVKDTVALRRLKASISDTTSISMLSIMGHVFSSQGLTMQALETYTTVLNLRRACLGMNHPSIVDTLADIAFVAKESGEFSAAKTAYNEVIRFHKRTGIRKGLFIQTIKNKGDMQYQLGEFKASLISYAQALRYCQRYHMGEEMIEDMKYKVSLIRYKHFQNDYLCARRMLGSAYEFLRSCEFDFEWLNLYNECIEHILVIISEAVDLAQERLR